VTKKLKSVVQGRNELFDLVPDEQLVQTQAMPMLVEIDALRPSPYQPRIRIDQETLYSLADSIKSQGVIQPILVRPLGEDALTPQYEIIAGERRFRAARLAGLAQVPVLVSTVSNRNAAVMTLIENMQRQDLNALEEAQGLQRLISEFHLTHDQAAQAIGRSRSTVSNLLRLLELAQPVQAMLLAGHLDMGHARALLCLAGAVQITTAHQIVAQKLSVRQAEALVNSLSVPVQSTEKSGKRVPDKSNDVRHIEEELSDYLTAEVEIRIKKSAQSELIQRGELVIAFGSLEELNGLIERLCPTQI
jgi:ParB family chromosome partitioning protein